MKRTVQSAVVCGTTMTVLNILNQLFFNPKEKFDFEELFECTLIGAGIGATVGVTIDTVEYLSKNDEKSELSLPDKVWNKGDKVWYLDSNVWRKDKYGNTIKYSEYGNRKSDYGWEKDHSKPKSKGGKDHLNNFQPLQWKENLKKSNKYPYKK
ncbi:HNH endonuclease [Aureispira anguillae]|uniref:HNH endonuclease n=1 Tax=Aureispira anguillae TaxID=2864201 RepID=A0A915YEC9_9BACT|nr:HNH endonuclease [Aureispira anguillae]BDS11509.1 HNH endonuclease [Aureispira anguillae]